MVSRAQGRLALAAVGCVTLAGCVQDHYACQVDTDCNLGEGGRCEADHHCTHYDSTCPLSERSYTAHSEAESGTCFAGLVPPLDDCAAGQPPAPADGCAGDVCAALPACCTTGWSEACVLEAQRRCPEVECDTRVAITAVHGTKIELWDLRFDGQLWSATPRGDRQTMLSWLAPAPGEREPRLAGFTAMPGELAIEGPGGVQLLELDPTRVYNDLQSLDFDRDLRDTLLIDFQDADARVLGVEVLKLDQLAEPPRELDVNVASRMAWGAIADDHGVVDGYPDGVVGQGAVYKVLRNLAANDRRVRELDETVVSMFDGLNTPGAGGALRTFSWADLDGDGSLDLVAFGDSIRVHSGTIEGTPFVDIDCDPPSAAPACAPESTAYSGAVLPIDGGARIVAAPFDAPTQVRTLYAIDVHPDRTITAEALPLPPSTCPTCPIIAIFARDLDGDHQLDLVAVDSQLTLDVALSSVDSTLHTFREQRPIAPVDGPFGTVRLSVTGASR